MSELVKENDTLEQDHCDGLVLQFFELQNISIITFLALKVPPREVTLILKHGVEAKNYEETGKAEKLKPLEIELRRLEDLSESIVNDFSYMKQREEQMRDTNGRSSVIILM